MSSLNLIAELLIRTQKRIQEVPSLTFNWLRVKLLHADKKIMQLKKGDLGSFVAIVAVFPGTSTFNSVARLLGMLESNGYSILVVINDNSEASQWFEKLTTYRRTLILRPNIGADFGAYKCGFNYLRSYRINLEVVLIANDSLHYTTSCEAGLSPLLHPTNSVNCLFLNFQSVVHAGSMLIKFNYEILSANIFWNFWKGYHCSNSKRWIIKHGEHRLSEICGLETFKPLTDIFLSNVLPKPTIVQKLQYLRWARRTDNEFFASLSNLDFGSSETWDLAFHYGLRNFQVSNSLGLYISEHFNTPIKMDLVKNGLVTYSDFASLIGPECSDVNEKQELIHILDVTSKSNVPRMLEKIRRF